MAILTAFSTSIHSGQITFFCSSKYLFKLKLKLSFYWGSGFYPVIRFSFKNCWRSDNGRNILRCRLWAIKKLYPCGLSVIKRLCHSTIFSSLGFFLTVLPRAGQWRLLLLYLSLLTLNYLRMEGSYFFWQPYTLGEKNIWEDLGVKPGHALCKRSLTTSSWLSERDNPSYHIVEANCQLKSLKELLGCKLDIRARILTLIAEYTGSIMPKG